MCKTDIRRLLDSPLKKLQVVLPMTCLGFLIHIAKPQAKAQNWRNAALVF